MARFADNVTRDAKSAAAEDRTTPAWSRTRFACATDAWPARSLSGCAPHPSFQVNAGCGAHPAFTWKDGPLAFELMPLPFDKDALAPAISAETFGYHHGKHHKAYIDKTNAAIEGSELAGEDLETVIARARDGGNRGLFNNAAQSWNHGFYWNSLSPEAQEPSGELAAKIDAAFGSLAELKAQLAERGTAHFSNGWVWLADDGGTLDIAETHDGDTLADGAAVPLLTIDLWEHAYYLDHQNLRPDYLKQVIERHLNWAFAADNLARGSAWKYPAPAYAD